MTGNPIPWGTIINFNCDNCGQPVTFSYRGGDVRRFCTKACCKQFNYRKRRPAGIRKGRPPFCVHSGCRLGAQQGSDRCALHDSSEPFPQTTPEFTESYVWSCMLCHREDYVDAPLDTEFKPRWCECGGRMWLEELGPVSLVGTADPGVEIRKVA